MAANQIPNPGSIAPAPPKLPPVSPPAQGSVPTNSDTEDEELQIVKVAKATKNAQGDAVPTATVDNANMLTYHHARAQDGTFLSRIQWIFNTFADLISVVNGAAPATVKYLKQALDEQVRSLHAYSNAVQAKEQNGYAYTAWRHAINININSYAPISKSYSGLGPNPPANLPANMPPAKIYASLPISPAPVPDWALPASPDSGITANRVRLIEYWYNEDFQLPENASDLEAAQCLDKWMRTI